MKLLKNKTLRLILILALIAGLMLGLKILFSQEKEKIPALPLSSPTITSFPTIAIAEPEGDPNAPLEMRQENLRNYPLFDYIPYKTKNWQIDYLKPLTLEIILKADTLAIRQEVLNWIKEKGVDPASHEIIWKNQP